MPKVGDRVGHKLQLGTIDDILVGNVVTIFGVVLDSGEYVALLDREFIVLGDSICQE